MAAYNEKMTLEEWEKVFGDPFDDEGDRDRPPAEAPSAKPSSVMSPTPSTSGTAAGPRRKAAPPKKKLGGISYKSHTKLQYTPGQSHQRLGFKSDHILLKANGESGLKMILRDILDSPTGCSLRDIMPDTLLKWPDLRNLISSIQNNFKKFKFSQLMHILDNNVQDSMEGQMMTREEVLDLLKVSPFTVSKQAVEDEIQDDDLDNQEDSGCQSTSLATVLYFLKKVLEKIVPDQLWGNQSNKDMAVSFLKKILAMGQYDALYIGTFLDKIQLKPVRWLQETDDRKRLYLTTKVFTWVVYKIMIASLRAFFHASKVSGCGERFFFFTKSRFHALHEKSRKLFTAAEEDEDVQGTVKLVPKKSGGVRPFLVGAEKNVNPRLLRASNLLLKYLSDKEQGFKRPAAFLQQWTNAMSVLGEDGPLYFLKTDIKSCYRSVSISKLDQLLQSTLFDPNLFEDLKKSYEERHGTNIPKYEEEFYVHMFDGGQAVDKGIFRMFVNLLWSTIDEAMKPAVKFGKKKVKLAMGLPEGSRLSPNLCDFYYSKMISTCLQEFIANNNGVLLRTADDFLYISHNKEMTEAFRDHMARGIPEFNCYINNAKTVTNCNTQVQRVVFNGYVICFLQKKVLVNTSNLNKVPCRNTMAFNNKGNFKTFLKKKILHAAKVGLSRPLIEASPDLNTLQDNVWRLGVVCGYKIQALLTHAWDFHGKYNSKMFFGVILSVGRSVFRRIVKARQDLENMTRDLFMSIFLSSIYCSLAVISGKSWKMLAGKLHNTTVKKIKALEQTGVDRRLLKYLNHVIRK